MGETGKVTGASDTEETGGRETTSGEKLGVQLGALRPHRGRDVTLLLVPPQAVQCNAHCSIMLYGVEFAFL